MTGLWAKLALPLVCCTGVASLRTRSGSGCACLSWKDVYAAHGVQCGSGHEFEVAGIKHSPQFVKFLPAGLVDEFCTRFYMRASFNACLNTKFGTPTEQWCYVSAECSSTQKVQGTGVAVKMCGAGDDLTSIKAPEEVNRLASIDNLEIGLFGKLSYAMDPMKWSEVEAASDLPEKLMPTAHTMESLYGIKWGGLKPVTGDAQNKVRETRASGIITLFDADNGHGGGVLMVGPKIYGFLPLNGSKTLGYVCMSDAGTPCK